MAADGNTLRWKLGWSPWLVIGSIVLVSTIVGVVLEATGWFLILGLAAGFGTWYWGVVEINDSYRPYIEGFLSRSAQNAKRGIDVEDGDLYNLTYTSGQSPPLVEPDDTYSNTTIVVTETSINLNKGATYDMKSRSGSGGGTNEEIYYDQVTGVQSHQGGNVTELEIQMSGGNSTKIRSNKTDTVDSVVSDVRQRVRKLKKPGAGHQRADTTGTTAHAAGSEHQETPRRSSATDSTDRSVPDHTGTESSGHDSSTHPVTAVADSVGRDADPRDSLAEELCRVLADPSANEAQLETTLETVVDRLERTKTVTDTVERIDDPTATTQIESVKRTLVEQDDTLSNTVERLLDQLLEGETASTVTDLEETLSEREAELERHKTAETRLRDAASSICRDASQRGVISFQSDDVIDRTDRFAAALKREDIVLETPDSTGGFSSVVDDVEQTARPQTAQSRRLLETIGNPEQTEAQRRSALQSAVETLDEFAELQAAIADIGERDVRRRLDSLDDELQSADGAVYRHLADRVRELESMLNRGRVDDVQLYAIYQESTFYDRTLLPRLSRSQTESESVDTDQLRSTVDARIASIENEYVSVRADHNHTIPTHFLSLAEELSAKADSLERQHPQRAAGVLSATNDLLGHVEQLYERNEYSVMLRRLRG